MKVEPEPLALGLLLVEEPLLDDVDDDPLDPLDDDELPGVVDEEELPGVVDEEELPGDVVLEVLEPDPEPPEFIRAFVRMKLDPELADVELELEPVLEEPGAPVLLLPAPPPCRTQPVTVSML
jgi:hypothetical protein